MCTLDTRNNPMKRTISSMTQWPSFKGTHLDSPPHIYITGQHIAKTITNVMWYLDPFMDRMSSWSVTVPDFLHPLTGYRQLKKKGTTYKSVTEGLKRECKYYQHIIWGLQRLKSCFVINLLQCASYWILKKYSLLDSLVVLCWLRVREVQGSNPSQGPRHTKDVIKWYQ